MDTILIRRASLKDLEALLLFEQGVNDAERPFDKTLKDGIIHHYDIKEMITDANIELIVAELDQRVVGSGYARIDVSKPNFKHKRHAYLGFMYVDPIYRGKDVNKKIIESLQQWAVSQDVTEIRLEVYNGNIAAIKAYEKIGFTKHIVEMRKGLKEV